MVHPHRCWPRHWTRDQCVTVAQLRTGHSPLLTAYLHRIGRRDSATCPHCNGADETAEHLVLYCPAHDQARRESWPNLHYQSDPRHLWSFLERIEAMIRPPDREWEREKVTWRTKVSKMTNVTAPALYMVKDWGTKWWRDESWGVTGRLETKAQKWRVGVNCSRWEQQQPERLCSRRRIVECGRRSVMKTRQNGVTWSPTPQLAGSNPSRLWFFFSGLVAKGYTWTMSNVMAQADDEAAWSSSL